MLIRIYAILFILLFLSACSFKQQFHPYPKPAEKLIQQESCDCKRVTILENEPEMIIKGSRIQTEGSIQIDNGPVKSYRISKSPLQIKSDLNLLHFSSSADNILELINNNGLQHSINGRNISQVSQSLDISNPFDGGNYRVSARYDGESIRFDIGKLEKGRLEKTGQLLSADSARINQRDYRFKLINEWPQKTEDIKSGGKSIWHQYPEGSYSILSSDPDIQVKLFQGAQTTKVLGLDTFQGYRSLALVPANLSPQIEADIFLFFYSLEFAESFIDDFQQLPYCLSHPEAQKSGECPNLYIQ